MKRDLTNPKAEMCPFVHLHTHTEYSLLDSIAKISELVDKAMADGMPGIAITDHANMFGVAEFLHYVESKNRERTLPATTLCFSPKTLRATKTS